MKKIFTIILLIVLSAFALAQTATVRGVVRDSRGEVVVGAVVMPVGIPGAGTVTDAGGNYKITFNSDKASILQYSCMSFKTLEVKINSRAVIDVVLEDDTEELEETVVIGYGSMRKSDLTGSVSSIKIDDELASRSTTIDQMLQGRAAGMQVLTSSSAPDAGVTIRIRGISTFTGNSDPLYVVDGVIVNGGSESLTTIGDTQDETNGLAGINPQDIASIEILKDASATAIYGSQGSNGVILITTKQAQNDRPKVNFNAGVTVQNRMNKLDVLDFEGYVHYLERIKTDGAQRTLSEIYKNPETHEGIQVYPVDWQDYVMRTSISQRYYFSVTGRPNGFNYLFSIGYNHNEGIIKTSSADVLTMRLNLQKSLSKKLTIGTKSSFGYTFSNILSGASSSTLNASSGLMRSMLRTRPFSYDDPDNIEGDVRDDPELIYGPNRWVHQNKNTSERFRVNPSVYVQWDITPWLYFKSTLGGELESQTRLKTISAQLAPTDGNSAARTNNTRLWYNWDNILMFRKRIKKFNGSITFGQSCAGSNSATERVFGHNLQQYNALEKDINSALPQYSGFSYAESSWTRLSFFARAILNYDDRYVLTATFREDGSSKFQGRNKWAGFPSFAFAWRLSDEHWFNAPSISTAKLRAGWGMVGSSGIDSYQTLPTYSTGSVGNHYSISGAQTSVYPSNIANPNLKWEASQQVNVGLDLSMWKGRFTLTVDAYNKESKDLLQNKYVARSTGFETIAINDGKIRNQGLEFTVDAVPVNYAGLEWGIGGNISFNRNTVVSVGETGQSTEIFLSEGNRQSVRYFNGSSLQNSGNLSPINIFIEGQPMGLFYGYKVAGIVQEGETGPGFEPGQTRGPGYIKYADLNGNGYIDEGDKTIIGCPLPDFTYGFNTSLSFKGFTLKAVFDGMYGADLFNLNNTQEYDVYQASHNVRACAVEGSWTPENKSNVWPALGCVEGTLDNKFSTRTVEDASYLRMSDLSLSYSFKFNKKKVKVLRNLDMAVSCSNVFIITKYSGWSPLNNSFGSNLKRMGIDDATSPQARSFNFDIKFVF